MAYSQTVRTLAKRANQRLVRMERAGIKSPAYRAAQAQLEMMGRGKRFSETGKGTPEALAAQERVLRRFLEQQTSTVTGAKEWKRNILEGFDRKYPAAKDVLTDDEKVEFLENVPDEPPYGSDITVQMVVTAVGKAKESDQAYSITDILKTLDRSKDLKSAMTSLGINWEDVDKYNPMPGNDVKE